MAQITSKTPSKRFWLLSIVFHAVIISLLFMKFGHTYQYKIPGKVHIVATSLYQPQTQIRKSQHKINKQTPVEARVGNKAASLQKKPQTKQFVKQEQKKAQAAKPQVKRISGKALDKLILLIYRQINAHKSYPAVALALNQQGVVNVTFELLPNGHIQHLRVLKGSRFSSLNNAALNAVKEAEPFAGIHQYLQNPETFAIKINFSRPS